MVRTICFGLLVWLSVGKVDAQDTSQVFSYGTFYAQLLHHHPLVKQSNLISESARRELLIARGGFDPTLQGSFDRKVYKAREYFNRSDFFLKVPVWLGGADLKVGYDRNVGVTLSDDIRTGPEGITYLGFQVPIGQGLLIDYRRATLKQAAIFQDMADAERVKVINKVVLTATKDYWDWYFTYQQYLLASEFYQLANVRFQGTRQRSLIGDLASIDTTEALVTLQEREVSLEQARLDLQNARLILSNHLWGESEQPLELPETAVPQSTLGRVIEPAELNDLILLARQRHPEIIKYDFKRQQLQIDERLGREMLKPSLNVNAAALYQGRFFNGQETRTGIPYLNNNYKLSFDLYYPLLLRKERGKLQQTRIKLLQNDLEQAQVQREINNEINAAYNEVKTYENQINTQLRSVANQEILLRAELQKLEMGESSLFLVNARESKLNESRVKVASLKAKYEKTLATLLFAAGLSGWE
ncbi:TolC family protein [Rhabdobacter roseus]|uniref:Outer membrane protein TolC n=1 Tax=Rhabdobacter roseus TaxID=1655419 RepID=A0A840TQQ6_9BACT|nr:TolC family protein [Rhabdobacter roseus]MBB5283573.1 outer membrane protein TolC [Rhabdobacter roseus]